MIMALSDKSTELWTIWIHLIQVTSQPSQEDQTTNWGINMYKPMQTLTLTGF